MHELLSWEIISLPQKGLDAFQVMPSDNAEPYPDEGAIRIAVVQRLNESDMRACRQNSRKLVDNKQLPRFKSC